MDKSSFGWIVAAGCFGLWLGQSSPADAAATARVECKAFYQDFPNGMVGPGKALEKAEELGQQVDPWLEEQFSTGASALVLHSFIPYGPAGGAELLCLAWK